MKGDKGAANPFWCTKLGANPFLHKEFCKDPSWEVYWTYWDCLWEAYWLGLQWHLEWLVPLKIFMGSVSFWKDMVHFCGDYCGWFECGMDGKGGSCGKCGLGEECIYGFCKGPPKCIPDCDLKECGPDGCGGQCGICTVGTECVGNKCECVPQCQDKECGDDGCEGSCGKCLAGDACVDGHCKCLPKCHNKECGSNGCGALCGICPPGHPCIEGVCHCFPNCYQKHCGDDGCGGSCGDCPEGTECIDSHCECVPQCQNKECGNDGCMGSCGECPEGDVCHFGVCAECLPECIYASCGPDGCGGSCGECPKGSVCYSTGNVRMCSDCLMKCKDTMVSDPDPVCGKTCTPMDYGQVEMWGDVGECTYFNPESMHPYILTDMLAMICWPGDCGSGKATNLPEISKFYASAGDYQGEKVKLIALEVYLLPYWPLANPPWGLDNNPFHFDTDSDVIWRVEEWCKLRFGIPQEEDAGGIGGLVWTWVNDFMNVLIGGLYEVVDENGLVTYVRITWGNEPLIIYNTYIKEPPNHKTNKFMIHLSYALAHYKLTTPDYGQFGGNWKLNGYDNLLDTLPHVFIPIYHETGEMLTDGWMMVCGDKVADFKPPPGPGIIPKPAFVKEKEELGLPYSNLV